MSETDSFLSEVSEEVRKEKFFAFLRRWGWLIALLILLIVGGAAANEWRKHNRERAAQEAGDALRLALAETDPADRAAQLDAVVADAPDAAPIARLAQAGALAEAGETQAAADVLAALATSSDIPDIYSALARLQRVMQLGPDLDASERLAALQGLTAPGAPFQPLALEQRALVHLEQGDTDAALADLEAVLSAPGATQAMIARARQLIVAAGGAVPLEGGIAAGDGGSGDAPDGNVQDGDAQDGDASETDAPADG